MVALSLLLAGCAGDIAFNGVGGPEAMPRKLAPVATPAPLVGPISVDGKPLKAKDTWMPQGFSCVGGSCPVER